MMTLAQTKTALAPGLIASFLAEGGIEPYVYSVRPNGAGGVIDSATGFYTAPAAAPDDPKRAYDTIVVTDQIGNQVSSKILVGTALLLVCEIIQQELGLPNNRVFIYNQKIFQPTDAGLYVTVSELRCKPFSNNLSLGENGGDTSFQVSNFLATLELNIISRDTAALNRKEEVLMALASQYSESQQEGNSFLIGRLPPASQFINLSQIDGAAIPYRFNISTNIQYAVTKTKAVPYFDNFQAEQTTISP